MAEEQGQERTERATPKRLEEARKKGQVPRSPELNAAAVTLAVAATVYALGGALAGDFAALMRDGLSIPRNEIFNEGRTTAVFEGLMLHGFWICVPLLATAFIAALLAPLAIGGWNFSSEALGIRFERISPVAGIGRMFSLRSLVELVKSLAKFAIVGVIAAGVLWQQSEQFLRLALLPTVPALGHALQLSGQALLAVASGLALIAAIDVPYQLWQHQRDLRMTRQEIREEFKETEGSPETRGRIRARQQELARQRMMQEIPTASVVVTNPEHYAVALRYVEGRSRAPVLVAKGVDAVAARIREVAREHNVPIFEAPPLARTLYRNVDLGVEIPAELYVAVAQVLTYVLQLQRAMQQGMAPPVRPEIDPQVENYSKYRRS
jgi:flagellar biosynthetic protein FlhB